MLLEKMLNSGLTDFYESFSDWREAVSASGNKLKEKGYIDDRYIAAVIRCIEKYGPYIVVTKDVAMPHATENADGVMKTGIAFMKCENPVPFDSSDPGKDVRLFFMLTSCNHEQHLQNLKELSSLLCDRNMIEAMLKARNNEDLHQIVDSMKFSSLNC